MTREDWRVYRDIRLQALKVAPDAFGSTYEASADYPEETWLERLTSLDQRFDFPALATVDENAVGLAWGRIEPSRLRRADLFQMWTDPLIRGKGVGRGLLDAVMGWARDNAATEIWLSVTVGNKAAAGLYESAGFRISGEPEQTRPGSEKYVNHMLAKL